MQISSHIADGRAVVSLRGRFDFSAHREFRGSCNSSLDAHNVRELELDMSGVEYLDSSALGMLLLLKEHADAVSKSVKLRNCRGAIKEVLDIANFAKLFAIE